MPQSSFANFMQSNVSSKRSVILKRLKNIVILSVIRYINLSMLGMDLLYTWLEDELGQFMGYTGLKNSYNEWQHFSWSNTTIKSHTAIFWLARALSRLQTTHTACHCAWKKQPSNLFYSTVTVTFDSAFITLSIYETSCHGR